MNYKNLQYTIVIQAAEEGGYIAFAPSLLGCMTQGETLEEVQENIKDAIEAYLSVLKEDGEASRWNIIIQSPLVLACQCLLNLCPAVCRKLSQKNSFAFCSVWVLF